MMIIRTIEIRPLEEKNIQDVVKIHQLVLGCTLNSRLGKKHLSFMYRCMSCNSDSYVGVAFDNDIPIGFVSGTVDMEKTKSLLLHSFKLEQWLNITLNMMRKPSLIIDWKNSNVIGRQVYFKGEVVAAILTTIGVNPNYQGKGVGKQLINALEEYFTHRKIDLYHLDTISSNYSARDFYKNLGFQEVEIRSDSVVLAKSISQKTIPSQQGVSVIMPTFNEAGNIQSLIRDTVQSLALANIKNFEIIVVDDDSPDLSWKIAAETDSVDKSKLHVIRRMKNHGLTASIRDGIAASIYDSVVWMDCDYSHPPEKISQMLYMLGQGYDVVVNSRYVIGGGEERIGKGGPLQLILSRLLNWGIRFMLTPSFSDYTSGFIAIRRIVLDEIELRGDYGEYFIDLIYRIIKTKKYSICELPYVAAARRSGESKTGTNFKQYLRRGWKYLWVVVKLKIHLY